MSNIEGIPEGWELVRVGKPLVGEFFIDGLDGIHQAHDESHFYGCAIIRKVERPKQYRAFENAAEAETLWDAKLQFKGHDADRFRVTAIRSTGVTIGGSTYRYEEAFERLECSDGTPFGMEVTS